MRKKYLLDDEPVTASQLIDAAASINNTFQADWLKSTSAAGMILRENGQTVEVNNDDNGEAERA